MVRARIGNLVVAACLVASCGGSTAESSGQPATDGGNPDRTASGSSGGSGGGSSSSSITSSGGGGNLDATASCGASGQACCNGAACNNGLTCGAGTCTAPGGADAASDAPGTGAVRAVCPQGCCGAADAGTADGGRTVIADSVLGFPAPQGQCGWSYGYLPGGAEPFTALTIFDTTQFTSPVWEESTAHPPWLVTFASKQSPNASPLQWNDRRWTSPVSGTVHIDGHIAKSDASGGDGVIGYVRVAGVEIWRATIAFNDAVGTDFSLSTSVQAGTTIDFLIDPIGTDLYDTTTMTEVISQ
jgi:hypothetical protein